MSKGGRRVAGALSVGLLTATVSVGTAPSASSATPALAPGAPGLPSNWEPGDKDGFGTAYAAPGSSALRSKVWLTLRKGALSEIYYPRIDTPASRDTFLVVSDGSTFTDREDRDTTQTVRLLDPRSLTYQQIDTAKSGAYRITKTYIASPMTSAVVADVAVESLTGKPYDVYLYHDPALSMTGDDDMGLGHSGGSLVAIDSQASSTVMTQPRLTQTSSGYLGRSDGWTDLAVDHRMDWTYRATTPGNVVQFGRTALTGLPGGQHLRLSIGFGTDASRSGAAASAGLSLGWARQHQAYQRGWHDYLASLKPVPASAARWRAAWNVSAMVLAASEDKTHRGGFVAAPGRPWAWANDLQSLAVYHAVWSRDLYQIATALIAIGDKPAANRALDFLLDVQQRPDGSFPQNSRLDGAPVFDGLQLDEVAFPIVLAGQLGRDGATTWARLKRSADFLVANGPKTPQERWENIGGFSPATTAAEIAGLVVAADMARKNGDGVAAERYLATADRFQRNVAARTATPNGPYSPRPYYLRITADGHPDRGTMEQIGDGGPLIDQRAVVDPSFLELVRLGVKRADDPVIRNSIAVVDARLGYSTANGPFWHRASFDGYGEERDGFQWHVTDPGSHQTLGRGWPLLTGERGEYVLVAGGSAQVYLDTMARATANSTVLQSEQVWDHRAPSGTALRFTPGEPTRSATPLAWTHAQFLRLAASIDAGHPVETPQAVACRYGSEVCNS